MINSSAHVTSEMRGGCQPCFQMTKHPEIALDNLGEVLGVAMQKCGHLTAKLATTSSKCCWVPIAGQHHAVHHLPVPGVYRVDLMITLGAKMTDE